MQVLNLTCKCDWAQPAIRSLGLRRAASLPRLWHRLHVDDERRHKRRMLRGRMLMKPVIAVELAAVLLLAGVGVAYALPQHTVTPGTEPWAGTASIAESGHLSVTDCSLVYDVGLTHVTGVTVEVTNDDSSDHTADIKVAVLDGTALFQENGEATGQTCAGSTATQIDVALDNPVGIEDADTLNVVVIDNG